MPLRRELEYLQLYLSNEEVRFQDRLKVEITADPVLLDAAVPQMAQQPIVENAIRPLKSAHHSRFGAPARRSISPKVLAAGQVCSVRVRSKYALSLRGPHRMCACRCPSTASSRALGVWFGCRCVARLLSSSPLSPARS